jgi:hypothetical protein
MYLWLGDSVYEIDSLLLDWDLREEFDNVRQGTIFVTAHVCQRFSPLVNERKKDAWEQHHHLYGSLPINDTIKAHGIYECYHIMDTSITDKRSW